ncbi:hypothetical protein [Rhodococcus erythropolis]
MSKDNTQDELQLDNVDSYVGLVSTIRNFAKRLAKQSSDLDEFIERSRMPLPQSERIVASTIENFVYTVIKTREPAVVNSEVRQVLDRLEDASIANPTTPARECEFVPLSAIEAERKRYE